MERRTVLLDMDFKDDKGNNADDENHVLQPKGKRQKVEMNNQNEEENVPLPLIDTEMQNELMATPAIDRLEMITDMLTPSRPLNPDHDDYQCDRYNLHILHAITLENLGRHKEALVEWKKCAQFCKANYPPADETNVSIHVRTAICAYLCKEQIVAEHHASQSLEMHDLLFGGGVDRMRKRYKHEFMLMMWGGSKNGKVNLKEVIDVLWPCGS